MVQNRPETLAMSNEVIDKYLIIHIHEMDASLPTFEGFFSSVTSVPCEWLGMAMGQAQNE